MKLRTLLALVLIGLLAACGCRDKARDVAPDQQGGEETPKDKDPKEKEKEKERKEKERKEKERKEKERKEKEKGRTPGSPEPLDVQPFTEPNNEQEAQPEEVRKTPKGGKAELLPPPEVEK